LYANGVFVGFRISPFSAMILLWMAATFTHRERKIVHDILIALAFIGMVIAPAVVAAHADIADKTE